MATTTTTTRRSRGSRERRPNSRTNDDDANRDSTSIRDRNVMHGANFVRQQILAGDDDERRRLHVKNPQFEADVRAFPSNSDDEAPQYYNQNNVRASPPSPRRNNEIVHDGRGQLQKLHELGAWHEELENEGFMAAQLRKLQILEAQQLTAHATRKSSRSRGSRGSVDKKSHHHTNSSGKLGIERSPEQYKDDNHRRGNSELLSSMDYLGASGSTEERSPPVTPERESLDTPPRTTTGASTPRRESHNFGRRPSTQSTPDSLDPSVSASSYRFQGEDYSLNRSGRSQRSSSSNRPRMRQHTPAQSAPYSKHNLSVRVTESSSSRIMTEEDIWQQQHVAIVHGGSGAEIVASKRFSTDEHNNINSALPIWQNTEAYRHANAAGTLWQSLVGEHVRFPKEWFDGARVPKMGGENDVVSRWKYISRNRVKNPSLNTLIGVKTGARILLHIIVLDIVSLREKEDIVIGCFHPSARGLVDKMNAFETDAREIYMGIRTRSRSARQSPYNSSLIIPLLTNQRPLEEVGKRSPLGDERLTNENVRAVLGGDPPLETVFVVESELTKVICAPAANGSHIRVPPSITILQEYLFR